MSQPTISRLERGETDIAGADAATVTGLAAALDEPIADLLRAAGITAFAGLSPEAVQAAYDLERLPQARREAVVALIAALLAEVEGAGG